MYLNFNSLQTTTFYFRDQLLSSLTPLQKKVVAVAALVLSCMVAIALLYRCCLRLNNSLRKKLKLTKLKKRMRF